MIVAQYENVIENHEQVRDYILNERFTWHYHAGNTDGTHPQQFEHHIYHPEHGILDNYLYKVFEKLVYEIYSTEKKRLEQIGSIKINLLLPPHKIHPYHKDDVYTTNSNSILYYPHNTTGNTNFTVGEVEPKENTAIMFPSQMLHSASSPHADRRITVNIVTKEKV